MKIEIIMPQMGESITEGTIIKWHKKKGDKVKKDEIIYEISTDKVDTEIPSPEDGTLFDIKVFENETVKVGTVVAILETSNNEIIEVEDEIRIPAKNISEGEIVEIPMPKMGESITEGTIIKWHKKVGDTVKRDEIIFEISTDKVDTEVPSPIDGIVLEILFNENDTVAVGTTVAKILTTSESHKSKDEFVEQIEQKEKSELPESNIEGNNYFTKEEKSNRFYSPSVLNIAREEGISIEELNKINGTGLKGRITKKDVLDYIEKKKSEKITEGEKSEILRAEKQKTSDRIQIIPIDHIRQRIMSNMVKSRDTSVHVTSVIEADVSKIHNFINQHKDDFSKDGIKLTYLPFISYAAIKALKEYPLMNSTIEENNIIVKKYINLGIAIALEPNGLIVPNIKNADEMNIRGLAKAITELGSKARTKKLLPEDITDGTFTITNYGVFGTLLGTPIINQPEVGILGVGTVTKKPVAVESEGIESIAIKLMMYLSLSHDHRLVDGMLGGKFLMSIKNTLENFDENLV